MTEQFEYVATCLFGLEKFVGDEIQALGYERIDTMDGRVTFRGDLSAIARCNLWLRCAERVYLKMGSFPAESFDALFEGTKKLPWERWIGCDDKFPVKGHSIRSLLFSLPDCQKIVKKAVVSRLSDAYGQTWFDETETTYQIEFFIFNNQATLMIDTSGTALHKRGYRPSAGVAPLRETLAAAMVKLARPREDVLLWDPLCGSGTIALEAALMMSNTAPGLQRHFVCEDFLDIPPSLFSDARTEALDLVKRDSVFEAYASDIDPEMIKIARENTTRAGMQRHVKAFVRDARTIVTGGRRGTIVTNPPYGERLFTVDEAHRLYRELGQQFATLDRWQIYIISSDEEFTRYYGRKPDKVRRLYNGMLRCQYHQFFKNDFSGQSGKPTRKDALT